MMKLQAAENKLPKKPHKKLQAKALISLSVNLQMKVPPVMWAGPILKQDQSNKIQTYANH